MSRGRPDPAAVLCLIHGYVHASVNLGELRKRRLVFAKSVPACVASENTAVREDASRRADRRNVKPAFRRFEVKGQARVATCGTGNLRILPYSGLVYIVVVLGRARHKTMVRCGTP